MIGKFGLSFSAILVAVVFTAAFTETSYGQQPYQPSQPQYGASQQGPQQQGYQQPQGYSQPAARPPAVRPMAPIQPAATNHPAPPQAPFQLTPEQQNFTDRALIAWENYGSKVNTFETQFTLRIYGSVFANGQDPKPQLGVIKYGKPDKGFFEVTGDQPEKWICDGQSLYEYSHTKKEVVQHILPPEERGQAIKNGPLPFLFGSTAAELKRRYWIRADLLPNKQVFIKAFPKFSRDAADFCLAEMIVNGQDMTPIGIRVHSPNGKTYKSYAFQNVVVNDRNPLKFFQGDAFAPKVPRGWTKVVQNLQSAQANDPADPQRR